MDSILELKNVTKTYKDKKVVDDLSLNITKGEVFALLGANGAGKTTTIKMILGLAKTSSGNIEIEDGATIGYSPETPYFPPYLTAMEVMKYYAGIEAGKAAAEERSAKFLKKEDAAAGKNGKNSAAAGKTAKSLKDKAYLKSLLDTVGLEDSKTRVKNYSKGMIQRLALAQALISDPDILILDEPTAGLDAVGRKHNLELLKKLKDEGKTIIINSHILHDIEAICDRGVIMNKGTVIDAWQNGVSNESLEDKFVRLIGEE